MPVYSGLEVFTTSESDQWNAALDDIGEYDFCHMAAFHRLAELRGEGEAVMPVYREGDHIIAFPLLFRDINIPAAEHFGEKLRDATCVYGLTGPLASSTNIPERVIKNFQQHLDDFFEQNQIISVFSRIHPLINHSHLLSGYGETIERGILLAIDTTPPPDVQYKRYRRNHKKHIEQSKEMGFTCEKVGIEHLNNFIDIYYETMDRVNAEKFYYFDRQYFNFMMREMSDTTHLFICRDKETIISAVLCTECKGIMQLYLGGTINDYVHLSPTKFLYNAAREWGNEIGVKAIQMGGGTNASRDDNLYNFKMGFGCEEHVYSTWRHIVNPETYDSLCSIACSQAGIKPESSYFPIYRHPDLQQNKT